MVRMCRALTYFGASDFYQRRAEMDRYEVQQPEEQEIDLLEVVHVLWRKAWIIVLAIVVGVALTGIYTVFFVTPQYEATSGIYILSKSTSITSLADLQIGSSLTADYRLIATTREVMQEVMEDFHIDKKYEAFVKSVEITNPSDSHILNITVTNEDPVLAAQLSNAIADQLMERIPEVMTIDSPTPFTRAVVPQEASSPSILLNCVVAALVCFAVAAGAILINHFLDDTIKDADDVQRYLHLNTLAAIPLEHAPKPVKGAAELPSKNKNGGRTAK